MNEPVSSFLEINGAKLHYEVSGEGHPLILLHAGIADSRLWDHQVNVFNKNFKVIRYDLRGFGQSSSPDGEFSHRADLHALLTALGVSKAHLVGVSMGGSNAIDFTLEHPDMVASLVTVGSSASGYNYEASAELKATLAQIDADFEVALVRGDIPAACEVDLKLWVDGLGRTPNQVDPIVREAVRVMNENAIRQYNENAKQLPLDPPAAGHLADISVPSLHIVGEYDLDSAIAGAEFLATHTPQGKQVIMKDTAHVPPLERPEEFNQIVLDFLKGK